MARDKGLEALIADDLGALPGLGAKTMFGGLAWLLHGNLLCAARQDGFLVRLGKGNAGWALALPGIHPMMSGSRRMEGWVRALPEAYAQDELRNRLIQGALAFVRPMKPK
jgi:hypothetical protein